MSAEKIQDLRPMDNLSLLKALVRDHVLFDMTDFVNYPMRTGIQRVTHQVARYWPADVPILPFVIRGPNTIGLIEPGILKHVESYFGTSHSEIDQLRTLLNPSETDQNEGYFELRRLGTAPLWEVSAQEAARYCKGIINIELSFHNEFYRKLANLYHDKVYILNYDYIVWLHPKFNDKIDWRNNEALSEYLHTIRQFTNHAFISTATLKDFKERINRGDKRVYPVIIPGGDGLGRAVRHRAGEHPEFVVVGTVEPRKQPVQIIKVFEKLHSEGIHSQLTFCGRLGWLTEADQAYFEDATDRNPLIRWLNSPNDDQLRDIVSAARATIYFSEVEGFGAPPIEGLWLGVPAIVSASIPSVQDLSPHGQIRVDHQDPESLERAVRAFMDLDFAQAKQDEIANLVLPGWQSFIEGIAKWVAGADPAAPLSISEEQPLSFVTRVGLLRLFEGLSEISDLDLVTRLIRVLKEREPVQAEKDLLMAQLADCGGDREEFAITLLMGLRSEAKLDPALIKVIVGAWGGTLKLPLRDRSEPREVSLYLDEIQEIVWEEEDGKFIDRCFAAFLGRNPDREARLVWCDTLRNGMERLEAVRTFVECDECRQLRPSMEVGRIVDRLTDLKSDGQFANLMRETDSESFLSACYRSLLGRPPDPKGMASHLWALQRGRSRREALLRMLTSHEHLSKVTDSNRVRRLIQHIIASMSKAELVQAGLSSAIQPVSRTIDDLPARTEALFLAEPNEFVALAFDLILNRQPSSAEQRLWEERLARGRQRIALVDALIARSESSQAQEKFGQSGPAAEILRFYRMLASAEELIALPDPKQFIQGAYQLVLGRAPDASGFEAYSRGLASGMTRVQCILALLNSQEYSLSITDEERHRQMLEYIANLKSGITT